MAGYVSVVTQTPGSGDSKGLAQIKVGGSENVKTKSLTLTNAAQEYSYLLTDNLDQLMIKQRNFDDVGMANLRIGFESGITSGVDYISVKNNSFHMEDLNFVGKTLYIQSDIAGAIIEVIELF